MRATDPVNRFMTAAVLTVDINDPAGEVLRLFAGYPVHHLPVLEQQKVVGMLSSADVMKLDLFLPKGATSPIDYLNQRMKVGSLLRGPALTIQPRESVESAAKRMAQHGVHGLAVVDALDHLLGIITTTDIIHAALAPRAEASAQGAAAETAGTMESIRLSAEQFHRAMTAAVANAGTDRDPELVHQTLLHLHAQVALLDKVRQAASRFVHAGQDQRLHTALLKALEAAAPAEQQGHLEAVVPL